MLQEVQTVFRQGRVNLCSQAPGGGPSGFI